MESDDESDGQHSRHDTFSEASETARDLAKRFACQTGVKRDGSHWIVTMDTTGWSAFYEDMYKSRKYTDRDDPEDDEPTWTETRTCMHCGGHGASPTGHPCPVCSGEGALAVDHREPPF